MKRWCTGDAVLERLDDVRVREPREDLRLVDEHRT